MKAIRPAIALAALASVASLPAQAQSLDEMAAAVEAEAAKRKNPIMSKMTRPERLLDRVPGVAYFNKLACINGTPVAEMKRDTFSFDRNGSFLVDYNSSVDRLINVSGAVDTSKLHYPYARAQYYQDLAARNALWNANHTKGFCKTVTYGK